MCRSIQTLRPPYAEDVGPEQVRAAALQYVRKVVGMRRPAPHNAQAFEAAVDAVTAATEALLRDVVVRPRARKRPATEVAGPS
jgi:hypothetical protein